MSSKPQTYIVRLYRRTAGGGIGHVEEVRTGAVRPFKSATTLWKAILPRIRSARSRAE